MKKAAEEGAKVTESSDELPKKREEEVPATENKPAFDLEVKSAAVKGAEGEVSLENVTKAKDDQVMESKSVEAAECGCILI